MHDPTVNEELLSRFEREGSPVHLVYEPPGVLAVLGAGGKPDTDLVLDALSADGVPPSCRRGGGGYFRCGWRSRLRLGSRRDGFRRFRGRASLRERRGVGLNSSRLRADHFIIPFVEPPIQRDRNRHHEEHPQQQQNQPG